MANVKNFQLLDDFHFHVAATEIECFLLVVKSSHAKTIIQATEHNGSCKLRAADDILHSKSGLVVQGDITQKPYSHIKIFFIREGIVRLVFSLC